MSTSTKGRTYDENIKQLYEIMNLEKNWNGHNADPIPESVIANAHDLLDKVKDTNPGIFPTASSSVQFEWYNDHDAYLEVEIMEKDIVVLFSTKNGDKPETSVFHKEIAFDVIEIDDYVKRFLNGEHLL